MKQTKESLQKEIWELKRDAEREALIAAAVKDEQKRADGSYAPIIVKTIVFTAVGAICLAFIAWITKTVWPH